MIATAPASRRSVSAWIGIVFVIRYRLSNIGHTSRPRQGDGKREAADAESGGASR